MSEPYVGEIRLVPFTFAPQNWLTCDGSSVPVDTYPELFQLVGTTYGGDGQRTFNVPDLRGRIPQHVGASGEATGGQTRLLGQLGGSEAVRLTSAQMPGHGHGLAVAGARSTRRPAGALRAVGGAYGAVARDSGSTAPTGAGEPHNNVPPSLVLRWIICAYGVFPSAS